MLSRARVAVGPVYLFACLILGGSAQGIWQNMILQLAGVAILAWAAIATSGSPLTPAAKQLLWLAIIAIAVVAIQMVPLPPATWQHLGPRQTIAQGFTALGMAVPPEPLSVAPAAGLASFLAIIPPLALICAMVCLKAYRPMWIAVALIAGALVGIALGALQVATSNGQELSSWYLYEDTNAGKAVGFFANANHMATLLVCTVPFLAAIAAAAKGASVQRYSAALAVTAGSGILVLLGLGLNGSLAGYGLALPVLAASALIILPPTSRLRLWLVGLSVLLVIGVVAALESTAIGSAQIGEEAATSVQSRAEILSTTVEAMKGFMPFGSGLGSFQSVYQLYEVPQHVSDIFVVHAHNDYAELALELGVAGIILMVLFLLWWGAAVWRVWRTTEAGPFARAATIASAAILVHSTVDFPLRTAAIDACFAICLSLIADQRAAPLKEKKALRSKRHVEFA